MFKKVILFCIVVISFVSFAYSFLPEYGETLVFGRGEDSETMDPAGSTNIETFYAASQIYDTSLEFKPGSTELMPSLAEKGKN